MSDTACLAAHLIQDIDGTWVLWVSAPDALGAYFADDTPRERFPAGSGLSVAARATALARLGFAPLAEDLAEDGWQWRELRPDRGIQLLGYTPVRPLTVAERKPVVRRGNRPGTNGAAGTGRP
jgi:hypothetical protein